MANTDVLEEMARWRLAYDTVSALAARLSGDRPPPMITTHHGEHENVRTTPMTAHLHHHRENVESGHVTLGGTCCLAHVGDVPSIADHDRLTSQRNDDVIIGMSDRRGHQMPPIAAARGDGNRSVTSSAGIDLQSGTTSLPPATRGREHAVNTSPMSPAVTSSQLVLADRFSNSETVISSEAFDLRRSGSAIVATAPHIGGANDVRVTRPLAYSVGDFSGVVVDDPTSGTTRYTHTPGHVLPIQVADERHRSPFPFEADTLLELFDRLTDTFYSETFLWIYLNAVSRPSARRLRHCLRHLGAASGRSLAQATVNVLTGYLAGYRQSRLSLSENVESALRLVSNSTDRGRESGSLAGQQQDQAVLLGRLAVELGVALNPRQMFRSFSAVVRDLLARTATTMFSTAAGHPVPLSTHTYHSDHSAHGYIYIYIYICYFEKAK